MWFKKENEIQFEQAEFREERKDKVNPARGWYRLYSFDADECIREEELKWCLSPDERLVLVMIDLGSYRNIPLSKEALAGIRRIFAFFKTHQKEMILRFVYDREGRGMEKEPSGIEWIQKHMEQLGSLIQTYEKDIFLIQGLFIGSWGEMHSSHYTDKGSLRELAKALWEETAADCFFAVRRPVFWRTIFPEEKKSAMQNKMGFFNDGLLGSETDLGTYADAKNTGKEWEKPWNRKQELEFLEEKCRVVPNGGEAVGEDALGEFHSAMKQFSKMHISYLNSVYDKRVLERWKEVEYQGMDGYSYIGMHLGYRLVIRSAGYDKKMDVFKILIDNTGFAALYEKAKASVFFETGGNTKIVSEASIQAGRLASGKKTELLLPLPGLESNEEVKVFLSLKRMKDDAVIHFANEEEDERVYLGLLRKR